MDQFVGDGFDLRRLPFEVARALERDECLFVEQVDGFYVDPRGFPDALRIVDRHGNRACEVASVFLRDVDVPMLARYLASVEGDDAATGRALELITERGRDAVVCPPDSDMVTVPLGPSWRLCVHRSVCVPGWPDDR